MADDVPISFFPTGGLYLKTLAILMIEVRLPEIRNPGLSVSNWEIMGENKRKVKTSGLSKFTCIVISKRADTF